MAQNTKVQTRSRPPTLGHWLTHIRKTFRLLWSLVRDPRVGFGRKILFIGTLIIFGGILIIPDTLIAGVLAATLPVIAPFVGIPSGIIDIAAIAFMSYGLLRIFPRNIIDEHAVQLYGPVPDITPHIH